MKGKGGIDVRVLLALAVLVLAAGGVALATSGGGSSTPASPKKLATEAHLDASGILTPVRAAPPLKLKNYLGQPVDIASYRGKAVLVTFIYTNCPDVCPLITSNLRVAQNLMGAKNAAKAEIVAV